MTSRPKVSTGSHSHPARFCSVCNHKVYNLETHIQTEEHQRNLHRPGTPRWQDEWPKEKGLWWFYGWCFGKIAFSGKEREPELCPVSVHGTAQKGIFSYVTNGHWLYKAEGATGKGATGKWQKAVLPELPKLD